MAMEPRIDDKGFLREAPNAMAVMRATWFGARAPKEGTKEQDVEGLKLGAGHGFRLRVGSYCYATPDDEGIPCEIIRI